MIYSDYLCYLMEAMIKLLIGAYILVIGQIDKNNNQVIFFLSF